MAKKKAVSKKALYQNIRKKWADTKSAGRTNVWRIPDGRSTVRPVPFTNGKSEELFVVEWRHWNVAPGGGAIRCLEGDCPICELNGEIDRDVWDNIKGKKNYLVNVMIRKKGEPDELRVASFPPTVMDRILESIEDGSLGPDPLNLKDGYDWIVTKRGSGRTGTKYEAVPASDSSSVEVKTKPTDLVKFVEMAPKPNVEELSKLAHALAGG